MVSNLVENLTRDVMLELAGESYFERGEDYHRGGHVHDLVEHAGVVVARVAGTEDYRVRLWAEDVLVFSCDCPLGLDGEFCTHCVAAGLAWFEGDSLENAPGGSATMHDVQTYLEKQDREVLVRIVMQQAMEDERLRERLLLRTSRAEGLDLAAFRRAVDDAVDFDDYLGSPWDCASGIQNVVEAIAELLEEGFAPRWSSCPSTLSQGSKALGLTTWTAHCRRHPRRAGGAPSRSLQAGGAGPGGAGETALRVGAGRRPRYVLRRSERLGRRARKQRTRRV